jgi:hypothetical protein
VRTRTQVVAFHWPMIFGSVETSRKTFHAKGDGSDPAEVKVKVGADQIVSKVGVCKFLNAKLEGKRLKATMECQFSTGPLVGDVTFTHKTDGTVDFVDRDNNYTATLYRCPK